MRVGFYNHTSAVSGAEISLLLTMRHLREAEPVLFAPEGELTERARAAGIRCVRMPGSRLRLTRHPLRLLAYAAGMLAEGWRLARLARRMNVDLIHANSIRAGLIASLFGWRHRRPVVWHVRDMPPQGLAGRAVRRLAARSARAAICISEAVRQGMAGGSASPDAGHDAAGPAGRLLVVHNGVELTPASPEDRLRNRLALRLAFGVPRGARVLAVVGQIAPWKRQKDALAAVRLLLEQGEDVYLWIVGEPKFREENAAYDRRLRREAEEGALRGRVRFTGFRDDVAAICQAADALLLCSDCEPFGRVLIEAMAQGTPVVATRAGGVPEIVRDGVDGLLYRVGDVRELARCAGELLRDEARREAMGRSAAERARERFSIGRTVERIEAVYRELVPRSSPKVAIVHDYLNQMGGAERVVAVLHRMFPEAPIYTTIADRGKLLVELRDADIRTTWMQRIPGILRSFKHFFWLYPLAVRSIDLRGYDLVVSSSSAYAKGVRTPRQAVHVCYCHTPMRFAWDFDGYMRGVEAPAALKRLSRLLTVPLRRWDAATARRVDAIVANSGVVRDRIRRCYGRSAAIVHPPVGLQRFLHAAGANTVPTSTDTPEPEPGAADGYDLIVSRLVSYKSLDLAVQACTRLSRRLIVVGEGPDRGRLERMAGPTVVFTGRLPDEEVVRLMKGCRALLFPGVEDFGIAPLEVNACGRPVVAYRAGGALDTIQPGLNGLFFEPQTPEALAEALARLDGMRWDADAIRRHAETFGEARFESELRAVIAAALAAKGKSAHMTMTKEVTV